MTATLPPRPSGRPGPPAPPPGWDAQKAAVAAPTAHPAAGTDKAAGTVTAVALPAAVTVRPGRPTPARMRLRAAALVVVGVLVAIAGGWSFASADAALARADANAGQLVRLQELQTRLVTADASATNAFLVGGLEPVDRRAVYDDALAAAAGLVAQAARAQPADGAVLSALNASIIDYGAGIEQARATNRQALPVGAQYLRNASATLRTDALPALAALIDANEDRVAAEFSAAERAWVLAVLAAVLALAAVIAASIWLSKRTHRYVNVPLAGAAVALLVLLIGSGVTLVAVATDVDRVRDEPFAAASALSRARLAAFDAKSNESLTLISRGSGQAFEDAWVASSERTVEALDQASSTGVVPADLAGAWAPYAEGHQAIRELDDGGAWENAVAAATSDADGSANAAFSAFDGASSDALASASERTSADLGAARAGLGVGVWPAVLAGLAAAVLSWTGFARRIEEYR